MYGDKTALITGANGQDGYFLSKQLKRKNVGRIVGLVRPVSTEALLQPFAKKNLQHFDEIIALDITSPSDFQEFIVNLDPDYLFNFAAIAGSLSQQDNAHSLIEVNIGVIATILDAVKNNALATIVIQASSSEVFAGGTESPQDIKSPRVPRTIYGATKIAADNLIRVYRDSFNIECYSVILYSHESPLRPNGFFTKRIVSQAFDLIEGKIDRLVVYAPDATRDWGYAGDYCKEIVKQALEGAVEDRIIATGVKTTVRSFSEQVCRCLQIDYQAYAQEELLMPGRAREVIDVYPKSSEIPVSFRHKKNMSIEQLVRLLIRCEKYARTETI